VLLDCGSCGSAAPPPSSEFSAAFDEVFRSEGIRIIGAPRANAYAERFVRTVRAECLDWLLIVEGRHLEHVLRRCVTDYNSKQPHRALALRPPAGCTQRGPPASPLLTIPGKPGPAVLLLVP
jgi:putative transposase